MEALKHQLAVMRSVLPEGQSPIKRRPKARAKDREAAGSRTEGAGGGRQQGGAVAWSKQSVEEEATIALESSQRAFDLSINDDHFESPRGSINSNSLVSSNSSVGSR